MSRTTRILAFASLSAVAFAATILWVRDPDMFHHLAYGREIARAGLARAEPFLYPLQGQPNAPFPYWLGSLAIYAWHVLSGDGGLAFLPAAVAALLFAILLADSTPRNGNHSWLTLAGSALPLVLALEAFRERAAARTELFGLLFVAATAWAVRRFEEGRPRMILAFPALALVWSNVHPSVALGIGLVGLLAFLAPFTAPDPMRKRTILVTSGITVLAVATSFSNPSPDNPVLLAFRFVATAFGLAGHGTAAPTDSQLPIRFLIAEMQRPGLGLLWSPSGILLAVTVLGFLLRWRSARARKVLTVSALAILAFRAGRFSVFLAVICAPIAARILGEVLGALPERKGRLPLRATTAASILVASVLHPALASGPPEISFGARLWRRAYPIRAADYLESIGFNGRLYNTFQLGGYLEWRGIRSVYQDGRGALAPGTLEASFVGPSDPRRFSELDSRFRFDALVLAYPTLPKGRLESLRASQGEGDWLVDRERWSLVAFDDGGLVYLRRDGKYAAVAARDEYALAKPANASVRIQRSMLPGLLAEYRRSVAEAPSCLRCRLKLASFAIAAGGPAEAEAVLAPVLSDAERELPEIVLVAAQAAEASGLTAQARERYLRFLSGGGDDPGARRALARIALAGGDARGAEKALRPNFQDGRADVEDVQLTARIAAALGRPVNDLPLDSEGDRAASLALAQQHFDRALAAERAGDLESAVARFRSSLEIFDANAAAHGNLGFVLDKMGRDEDALREFRRAVELDPKLAAPHYGMGSVLAKRGDRAAAAAAFRTFLALEPSGSWAMRAAQRVAELERP